MDSYSWMEDFSYGYYIKILSLLENKFQFCSFYESIRYIGKYADPPIVLLRHDVDLDVDKALIMAKIEANMGISSCFMFLTNCPFYSINDSSVISAIQNIREMGHEIGLHYDSHQCKDTGSNIDLIEAECYNLESSIGSIISSISFHRPLPKYINGPTFINGRVNAYASGLMESYLSDSKGRWRDGEPISIIENYEKHGILQLLVHPIWWGDTHLSAPKKLQDFFNNKTKNISKRDARVFDNKLTEHLTVVRSDKLTIRGEC